MKKISLLFFFVAVFATTSFATGSINNTATVIDLNKTVFASNEKIEKEEKRIENSNFIGYPIFTSCGVYFVYTAPGVTLNSIDLIVIQGQIENNICAKYFIPA